MARETHFAKRIYAEFVVLNVGYLPLSTIGPEDKAVDNSKKIA